MIVIASTVFRTVQFLHIGRIVTIDQLNFCTPDVTTSMANNIHKLGQSRPPYQSIGVGMLKDSTPPNADTVMVNMISLFYYDPKGKQIVESTSLSPHEEMYNIIQTLSDNHTDDLHLVASYPCHFPY